MPPPSRVYMQGHAGPLGLTGGRTCRRGWRPVSCSAGRPCARGVCPHCGPCRSPTPPRKAVTSGACRAAQAVTEAHAANVTASALHGARPPSPPCAYRTCRQPARRHFPPAAGAACPVPTARRIPGEEGQCGVLPHTAPGTGGYHRRTLGSCKRCFSAGLPSRACMMGGGGICGQNAGLSVPQRCPA